MFKITASLNGKFEEFLMPNKIASDNAVDVLEANGYVVILVSERV
jgi:hypothetical protein